MIKLHSPTTDSKLDTKDDSLELFSLIWLDTNIDTEENQQTLLQLRTVINFIKTFKDEQECRRFVEQKSKTDRLFLITSGRLSTTMVPSIHELQQITSIYIFCGERTNYLDWTRSFPKIKDIVTHPNDLLDRIKKDFKIQMKVEVPWSINIFHKEKALMEIGGQFVFSQLIIDCLLRMKQSQRDLNELYTILSNEYEGNRSELHILQEFQESYSSTDVLRWYTRESFFHKILNATLRTQNIHMMFLFRSFITDIHHQLQSLQVKHHLRAFRGQAMSLIELQALQSSIGELISINSFFSCSVNSQTARTFLTQSNSRHMQQVLFEIDADPQMVTTKPFANISAYSEYAEEGEVLFSYGTIFRLNSVNRTEQHFWTIKMSLCNEDENELNDVLAYLRNQNGTLETNLRDWGKLLWEIGNFDLAEKYFYRYFNELLPNDPSLAKICEDLAKLAGHKSNFDMSMEWRKKSLQKTPIVAILPSGTVMTRTSRVKWSLNGVTVAGGHGAGNRFEQLDHPQSLCVSEDLVVYVADTSNHRIVAWSPGATMGRVVAGGNGPGNALNQLKWPSDVILDPSTNCLLICDYGNERVLCWPLQGRSEGELVLSDIACYGLALDSCGHLYVSDSNHHEVWRCQLRSDAEGIRVNSRNKKGNGLDQLNSPTYLFVDQDRSVYVSDNFNHRVMKWARGAQEGSVVAGGYGQGSSLEQVGKPRGILVDQMNTVYVADETNHRIMRWLCGATKGTLLIGGNGNGNRSNQLSSPRGLCFDKNGNLYVTDYENARIQKFELLSP